MHVHGARVLAPRWTQDFAHITAIASQILLGGLLLLFTRTASAAETESADAQRQHEHRTHPRPPSALGDGQWQPMAVTGHRGHVAAYDPGRHEMLVYGGDGGYNDAWALSLSGRPRWRLAAASAARYASTGLTGRTAIFDPVRDQLVTFGGSCYMPNDHWDVNHVTMISLGPTPSSRFVLPNGSPPCGRSYSCAMYDPQEDRMLLLGGGRDPDYCDTDFNDLWALSLGPEPTWTPLPVSGTPTTVRFYYSAILDPPRHRIVVFGGVLNIGGPPSDELWELSLSTSPAWTRLTPAGEAPSARTGHSAVYDPVGDRMLVYGGSSGDGAPGTVWALALAGDPAWSRIVPAGPSPSDRDGHTAVVDPVHRRMIVYGGGHGPETREVWSFSLVGRPRWRLLDVSGAMSPPSAGACVGPPGVFDPMRDEIAFFERPAGEPLDRLTTLSMRREPAWRDRTIAGPAPIGRSGVSAVRDTSNGRIIVFGGSVDWATPSNEVWALTLGKYPRWQALSPAGVAPSARTEHSAVLDPARRRMIVFGGRAAPGSAHSAPAFNDVWALSLPNGGEWIELHPLGTPPPPTWGHHAYLDPTGDRMIVYVGRTGVYYRREVWALSLSGTPTWSRLLSTPLGTPSDPILPAIHDQARDRWVVFNASGYCEGSNGQFPNSDCNGVWAVGPSAAPTIRTLAPTGAEPIPTGHLAVFDPVRDRMVVVAHEDGRLDVRALVWSVRTAAHDEDLEPSGPLTGTDRPSASGGWQLSAPQPDPAPGIGMVGFTVPHTSELTLTLFDILGRRIALLAEGRHEPGRYQVPFATPSRDGRLRPGVYLLRLVTVDGVFSRRFVSIR